MRYTRATPPTHTERLKNHEVKEVIATIRALIASGQIRAAAYAAVVLNERLSISRKLAA